MEAEKREHKAMLLRAFDCIEALLNQATKAMLLAATAALQQGRGGFRYSLMLASD